MHQNKIFPGLVERLKGLVERLKGLVEWLKQQENFASKFEV
jgi:hypothetical protein